jgi:hypothetical protein
LERAGPIWGEGLSIAEGLLLLNNNANTKTIATFVPIEISGSYAEWGAELNRTWRVNPTMSKL